MPPHSMRKFLALAPQSVLFIAPTDPSSPSLSSLLCSTPPISHLFFAPVPSRRPPMRSDRSSSSSQSALTDRKWLWKRSGSPGSTEHWQPKRMLGERKSPRLCGCLKGSEEEGLMEDWALLARSLLGQGGRTADSDNDSAEP